MQNVKYFMFRFRSYVDFYTFQAVFVLSERENQLLVRLIEQILPEGCQGFRKNFLVLRLLSIDELVGVFDAKVAHGKGVLYHEGVHLAGLQHADGNHVVVKADDGRLFSDSKLLYGIADAQGRPLVEGRNAADAGIFR